MKDIYGKSSQLFSYLRVVSFAIVIIIMVFAMVRASALGFAPHAPEMALDVKLDAHKKSVENANNQKAYEKAETYKNHKQNQKEETKKKRPDSKKERVTKPKRTHTKTPKTPKPPKPSKTEKKQAAKHKARTLS